MSAKVVSLSAVRDARAGWEGGDVDALAFPLGDGRAELRFVGHEDTYSLRVNKTWLTQYAAKLLRVAEEM